MRGCCGAAAQREAGSGLQAGVPLKPSLTWGLCLGEVPQLQAGRHPAPPAEKGLGSSEGQALKRSWGRSEVQIPAQQQWAAGGRQQPTGGPPRGSGQDAVAPPRAEGPKDVAAVRPTGQAGLPDGAGPTEDTALLTDRRAQGPSDGPAGSMWIRPRTGPTVDGPTAWPSSDQRLGLHTGATPRAPPEPRDASSQMGEQPGHPDPRMLMPCPGLSCVPQSVC